MTDTITAKNQNAVNTTSPEQLHVSNDQRTDCKLSPGNVVGLDGANQQFDENTFSRMIGIGIRRQPTAEIMRETRGEDSMR